MNPVVFPKIAHPWIILRRLMKKQGGQRRTLKFTFKKKRSVNLAVGTDSTFRSRESGHGMQSLGGMV